MDRGLALSENFRVPPVVVASIYDSKKKQNGTMAMVSSIEARLQALESLIGDTSPEGDGDVESRLEALQSKIKSVTPASLHSTWEDSDRLFQDLSPGSALSYQQSSKNYPILYRRKQILASADSLKTNFEQLASLVNLLTISQQGKRDSPMREEQVTQAPILVSHSVSREEERRLEALLLKVGEMNRSVQDMTDRVDALVQGYHSVIMGMSEKIVQADEKLK